jgi:uncharacterized Zn-binding protein involved in type VI secretion
MPAAARITDGHTCPVHAGGPIDAGCSTVIIGYEPAARVGDSLVCAPGKDAIKEGEPTVLIGNKPAARVGDPTEHSGAVAAGCPTVIIGSSSQPLRTDKPFCEECERKRQEREARAARRRSMES